MTDALEPTAHPLGDVLKGAVIGVASVGSACLCGGGTMSLLFVMGLNDDWSKTVGLPTAQFAALAPYVVVAVGLLVGAFIGRLVHDRWRGALNGAGGVAFTGVTILSVSYSPVVAATDWAVPLAAIASALLCGAAFLRPSGTEPATETVRGDSA